MTQISTEVIAVFGKFTLILLLSMTMVNPFIANFALAGADPIPAGEGERNRPWKNPPDTTNGSILPSRELMLN